MLSPEQIALRRTGISASESAALFGLDKFKSQFDVYVAKTEGWVVEQTPDMLRGECLEPGVADWYGRTYGVEVIDVKQTLRHAKRNLILATPDRMLKTADGELELLEIKVPRNFDEWGEDETQVFPAQYNVQVQQTAAVLRSLGHNVVRAWLTAPVWGDLRRYPVRLDDELADRIMSADERFWERYVSARVPPPIDGGEGARRWLLSKYPHAEGKEKVEATLAQEALCVSLRARESEKDAAEAAYETAKSKVIAAMGAAYGLKGNFGSITNNDNQWGKRTFRARWSNNNRKAAANG